MESYFYCSYENSKTGFFHTRLEGDALVPVEGGHEGLPAALGEFFSYGIFRLLWRDLAEPVEKPWRQPMPTAGMFGLRELEGTEALTGFSAQRKSLLPAPQMYWTRQSAEGPGGPFQTIFGNTSYYRLRTEDLALRVEAELRTWQEWYGGGEAELLEVSGLDSFWWAGAPTPG